MDQQTMDVVKEVVKDLTFNGKMFSAFDVTKVLRNEKGLQVFHSEVRKVVHDMSTSMELPVDYIRSNTILSNGKDVIVYHPHSADVSQYDEKAIGAQGSPFVQSQQPVVQPQVQAPIQPKSNNRDARGRFCISNKLTKQVGYNAGDRVFVTMDPNENKISITKGMVHQPAGSAIKSYQVDRDGNIRLSKKVLSTAGLDGKQLNTNIEGCFIVVAE